MLDSLKALIELLSRPESNSAEILSRFNICVSDYLSAYLEPEEYRELYQRTHQVARLCFSDIDFVYGQIIGGKITEHLDYLPSFYLEAATSYYELSKHCSLEDYYTTLKKMWAYYGCARQFGAGSPKELAEWEASWLMSCLFKVLPSTIREMGAFPTENLEAEWSKRLAYYFSLLKKYAVRIIQFTHVGANPTVLSVFRGYLEEPLLNCIDSYLNAVIAEQRENYIRQLNNNVIYQVEALCDVYPCNQRGIATQILNIAVTVSNANKIKIPTGLFHMAREAIQNRPLQCSLPDLTNNLSLFQELYKARSVLKKAFAELHLTSSTVDAQMAYTRHIRELLCGMMKKVTQILGNPPVSFCVLGMGSISRADMVLYSDVEFVLLINADTDAPDYNLPPYYSIWVALLKDALMTLGEPWIINIIKLNKPINMVNMGLRVDDDLNFDLGAAEKPWTIQSPVGMARWVKHTLQDEQNIHRGHAQALLQPTLLYSIAYSVGEPKLFAKYQEALAFTPAEKGVIAQSLWKFNRNHYIEYETQRSSEYPKECDIKKAYLQPLSFMVQIWGWLHANNTAVLHPVKILEQLATAGILAKDWADEAIQVWLWLQHFRITIQDKKPTNPDRIFKSQLSSVENTYLDQVVDRILTPLYWENQFQAGLEASNTQQPHHPVFAESRYLTGSAAQEDEMQEQKCPAEWNRIQKSMAHFLLRTNASLSEHHAHYKNWPKSWRWPKGEDRLHYYYTIQKLLRRGKYGYSGPETRTLLMGISKFSDEDGSCLARIQSRQDFYNDLKVLFRPQASSDASTIEIVTVDLEHPEKPFKATYYLSQDVEKQLFNEGEWQKKPKGQGGRHLVLPVEIDGKKFWAKIRPEQPGTEQAILELDYLLSGGGSIPEGVASILWVKGKPIAVWWSEDVGEHAEVLVKIKEDAEERTGIIAGIKRGLSWNTPILEFTNPQHSAKINLESFHAHLLRVLLTNPEDDKGDDYFLVPNDEDAWNLRRIDNERAYFKPEDSGVFKKNSLQVKSLLYCLDMMQKPINITSNTFQKLLTLDFQLLIEKWLRNLQDWHSWYRNITDESMRKTHLEYRPFITMLTVATPKEIIQEIFKRAILLQDAIRHAYEADACYTGLDLLQMTQRELYQHYQNAFDGLPSSPSNPHSACQRFLNINPDAYEIEHSRASVTDSASTKPGGPGTTSVVVESVTNTHSSLSTMKSKMKEIQAICKSLRISDTELTLAVLNSIARGLQDSPKQALDMLFNLQVQQLETIKAQLLSDAPKIRKLGAEAFYNLNSARRQTELIKRIVLREDLTLLQQEQLLDIFVEIPFQVLNFGRFNIALTDIHLKVIVEKSQNVVIHADLSNAVKITNRALENMMAKCIFLATVTLDNVNSITYLGIKKELFFDFTPVLMPNLVKLTLKKLEELSLIALIAPKLKQLNIENCEQLNTIRTGSKMAKVLLEKGVTLYPGNHDEAIQCFNSALILEPALITILLKKAKDLQIERDYINQSFCCAELSGNIKVARQYNIAREIYLKKITPDVNMFLKLICGGKQNEAEGMVQLNPMLLFASGELIDLSGRRFKDITAFQYTLWALDWHMWTMLLKYLPTKTAAEQSVQGGSWISQYGVHAGDGPLIKLIDALQTFSRNWDVWSSDKINRHWIEKVGGLQRLLPVHVINEYCHPSRSFYPMPDFTKLEENAGWRNINTSRGEWFTCQYHGVGIGKAFFGQGFAFGRGSALQVLTLAQGQRTVSVKPMILQSRGSNRHYKTSGHATYIVGLEEIMREEKYSPQEDYAAIKALREVRVHQRAELIADLQQFQSVIQRSNSHFSKNINDGSAIYSAALNGHLLTVQWLTESGKILISEPSFKDRLLVLQAVMGRDPSVLHWLRAPWASFSERDKSGNNALHVADFSRQIKIAQNDKLAYLDTNFNKWIILLCAARNGHFHLLDFLLIDCKLEWLVGNVDYTKLYCAVLDGDKDNVLTYKLKFSLNNQAGTVALLLAAAKGHLEIVQCLVELISNPEEKKKNLENVLFWIAGNRHLELLKWTYSQLHVSPSTVIKGGYGSTPLHRAARHGSLEAVRWLLEEGADKDERDDYGVSALDLANSNHQITVVKFLESWGRDRNGSKKPKEMVVHLTQFQQTVSNSPVILKEPFVTQYKQQIQQATKDSINTTYQYIASLTVVFQQKGWNCFDIAVGIEREQLVKYALANSANPEFRCLLAPEIRHAAAVTAVYMEMHRAALEDNKVSVESQRVLQDRKKRIQELCQIADVLEVEQERTYIESEVLRLLNPQGQEKTEGLFRHGLPASMQTEHVYQLVNDYFNAHEAMKKAVAQCNDALGHGDGHRLSLEELDQWFNAVANRTQNEAAYQQFSEAKKQLFKSAEQRFEEYCESEETYKIYVQDYYGASQWFAFQRQFADHQSTSMVDITARMKGAKIVIHNNTNRAVIYSTNAYGASEIHVEFNGINHFNSMPKANADLSTTLTTQKTIVFSQVYSDNVDSGLSLQGDRMITSKGLLKNNLSK
jgi:ankyrin repeat protein